MQPEKVVIRRELSAPMGHATYDQLKYADSRFRVSRLRIASGPWSYEIYGNFGVLGAMQIAWAMPPASAELNGIKATAGYCLLSESTTAERERGLGCRPVWQFRIETAGESNLEVGTVFNPWYFGLREADQNFHRQVS